MYTQKQSRDEKENYYKNLIKRRDKLENDPSVIAWKAWSNKPKEIQLAEIRNWDIYYAKVKESVSYAMFTEQREMARKDNWRGVKDLADQAYELRLSGQHLTTPEPNHADPWEFRHNQNITGYVKVQEEIKKLTMNDTQTDEIFN